MTKLTVYREHEPNQPLLETEETQQIHSLLQVKGIHFEQWDAKKNVDSGADAQQILNQYQAEIEQVKRAGGYLTSDVISLAPDSAVDLDALRNKFLAEHIHGEDEVRFFVDGRGLFCLHIDNEVYALNCEKNDLINVPAGTRHWFDMGENPRFTCLRFFNNPQGWVAEYTGNDIATQFPALT